MQRASGKGLLSGSCLTLHLRGGGSLIGNDSNGLLIPDMTDVAQFEIKNQLKWVLVVEKEVTLRAIQSWFYPN
jgi:meiotic recombination protein SPO11